MSCVFIDGHRSHLLCIVSCDLYFFEYGGRRQPKHFRKFNVLIKSSVLLLCLYIFHIQLLYLSLSFPKCGCFILFWFYCYYFHPTIKTEISYPKLSSADKFSWEYDNLSGSWTSFVIQYVHWTGTLPFDICYLFFWIGFITHFLLCWKMK